MSKSTAVSRVVRSRADETDHEFEMTIMEAPPSAIADTSPRAEYRIDGISVNRETYLAAIVTLTAGRTNA